MKKKPRLKLIRNELTYEERIQMRIDSFRRELFQGEGDIQHTEKVLAICLEYLAQFEDNDVYNAAVKVKESIFYLNNFINYDE